MRGSVGWTIRFPQPVVAMHDAGRILGGDVLGQPRRELVHGHDLFGLELGILPGPARELTGDVVAGAAIVAQPDLHRIDFVQAGEHVVHRIEDRRALGRRLVGHRGVDQDATRHGVHEIEHLADHRVVGAEQARRRHQHVGIGQRRDHPVFAVPLILLAVCAVGLIGYLARDFLIPTAAAIVLALMLTPVANTFERAHLPPTPAAAASVSLLALVVIGLLAVAIPSISSWASQAPYLTYTLERKLEGIRSSLAIVKQVSDRVEQATSATPASPGAPAPEKVVVREKSMLGELASTTPVVILQIGYAAVLAFMLLAHRNDHRRQMLRIPLTWATRVRLAPHDARYQRPGRPLPVRAGRHLRLCGCRCGWGAGVARFSLTPSCGASSWAWRRSCRSSARRSRSAWWR